MRRRHKESAVQGVDLGIIITPMLDMAFQLLAFFIMTYHPPASEAAVDGTLLPAAQVTTPAANAGVGLQVIVRAEKDEAVQRGQPTAIYLKRPKDTAPQLIAAIRAPGEISAAVELLAKELTKSRTRPDEKDLPLIFQADRVLLYGHLIAVQDVVRASGFKMIEFDAPR